MNGRSWAEEEVDSRAGGKMEAALVASRTDLAEARRAGFLPAASACLLGQRDCAGGAEREKKRQKEGQGKDGASKSSTHSHLTPLTKAASWQLVVWSRGKKKK